VDAYDEYVLTVGIGEAVDLGQGIRLIIEAIVDGVVRLRIESVDSLQVGTVDVSVVQASAH
jgi:hypothetical protein